MNHYKSPIVHFVLDMSLRPPKYEIHELDHLLMSMIQNYVDNNTLLWSLRDGEGI